jgi:MFS family permease
VPPLASGLALAALTLGWPLAASQSGRFYLTVGFKTTVLIGAVVATIGATVLALTAGTPNLVVVAACCFVIGLGMGFTAAPALILAQASVEWEERGTVTGSNLFARSVGSAVAAAVFGALANSVLGGASGAQGADASPGALTAATLLVFIGVAVCSAAMIVASATVPGGRPQTPTATPEPAESAPGTR